MIKYRAESFVGYKIKRVEVSRETEKSVWTKHGRLSKRSDAYSFFDTFEEAQAFLIEKAEYMVMSTLSKLDRVKGYLESVKGLTDK